jgi:diguanylate cyclase (GGDEF)-like protein
LARVADMIREHIRTSDIAIRFGGEEFLILLPNTDLNGATITANKIRSELEKIAIDTDKGQIKVTISGGVSSFKVINDTRDTLLGRADESLYQAKHSGRNQISTEEQLAA